MRIGQLAKTACVGVETIRYYQRIGLFPNPPKPYGGTRHYDAAGLVRLRFIRRAQGLGFSLEEIRALLELSREDCADVQRLATRKLDLVRGKIKDLKRMETALKGTLARCRTRRRHAPCPIIETLAEADDSTT
ncbi:MAG: MerR family transcriptional regulator [Nevskiales bacterium]